MDLLHKARILFELAMPGDDINLLAEIPCHLKDCQIFKLSKFAHGALFKIQDSGFRIQESRLRGESRGSGVESQDSRFKIQDSGFKVKG